jgi:CRISPR/Cas system CSM-associated protein Csm3 (group 7 of RAMP superfamily)
MFLQAVNEFQVRMHLKTVSPLLVKDGRFTVEVLKEWLPDRDARKGKPTAIPISRNSLDDLRSAVTNRTDPVARVNALTFYIPGSSLRGAWRSHMERVLRGVDPVDRPRVCDPLDDGEGEERGDRKSVPSPHLSCSNVLEDLREDYYQKKRPRSFPAYELSCPVCRLFGNTTLGGRLSISDGERVGRDGSIVQREHVAINRRNGQVVNPYTFFGLHGATFQIDLRLRNFELSQIWLLGSLLKELRGGLIPLGSGKNKGYGQVEATIKEAKLVGFGLEQPDNKLRGVAEHALLGPSMQSRYGVTPVEPPPLTIGKWTTPDSPWRHERILDMDEFDQVVTKHLGPQWDKVLPLSERENRRLA